MTEVRYIDLHLKDYKETWDFQQQLQNDIIASKTNGNNNKQSSCSLIFVEHPHVYTLGKSGKENNLLINAQFLESIGATFYKTDRGGDITYHGPGQLVGYPIFDLEQLGIGVKSYINKLEESIIETLKDFNIKASRLEGATGVWIIEENSARKVCAIGVKVSRGITMHGFALNVNTDLNYFSYINPCGFIDKGVTSMSKETAVITNMENVKEVLLKNISTQFGIHFGKN